MIASVVTGAFLAAAGVVLGLTIGQLVDAIRRGVLNSIDSPNPGSDEMMFPISVAMILVIVAYFAYHLSNRLWSGRTDKYLVVGPLALTVLGTAAGLWWSRLFDWAPADRIGATSEFVGGPAVEWKVQQWAVWSTEYWLAPLVTLVALYLLFIGRRSGRKADRSRAIAEELMVSGARVPGVVVASDPEPTTGQRVFYAEWTFAFADVQGFEHRISRTEAFPYIKGHPRHGVPLDGQQLVVLYDPAAPGDEDRVFTALGSGEQIDEFLRERY